MDQGVVSGTVTGSQVAVPATHRTRIAFCVDSFDVGGTELNAVRLAEAIDPRRFELAVCHLGGTGLLRGRYEAIGATLYGISIPNLYSPATIRAGFGLAAWLRDWQADVVHAHDIYSNIFAVPWARIGTHAAVIASRRWWYDAPRPGLIPLNRLAYRFAHRVLANSPGVGDLLRREEHVPAQKVLEVPNFLEDHAFEQVGPDEWLALRRAWKVPDAAVVVGSVARLAPVKNHASLLRAVATLDPSVHVVLVGDGPSRESLERLAADLGIGHRVTFLGTIVQAANLHQFFDISVLSSTSEGFPNSVIEALAAGRAMVATRVGGVTDIINDGVTGRLVDANDDAGLAVALRDLVADPALRTRLGTRGRDEVRARFHQGPVVDRLMKVYEELAAGSRSRK